MPPEIVRPRTGKELKAGDVWSIGVIAYVLVCGKVPFEVKKPKGNGKGKGKGKKSKADKMAQQQQMLMATLKNIGTSSHIWPSNINISNRCKDFVNGLLTKVPRSRTTAESALKHPWIIDNRNNPGDNSKAANNTLLANIENFQNAGLFVLCVYWWLCECVWPYTAYIM